MAEIVQGVTIKVRTEGASSVDGLSQSLGGATRAAGAAAGAANTAAGAANNLGGAANNAARGVNNAGGAAGGASNNFNAFAMAVTKNLLPSLFGTSVAADLTADAIKKLASVALEAGMGLVKMYAAAVREGIEFNALVEVSILGVASLLTTFGTFQDAQGRVAQGAEAFAAAQSVSRRMIEQVRIATLETTATFPEMLRALQEGMPSALQAGFNTKQVVDFSKAMAQAAGAIGMPIDQLGQEFRGVFDVDLSKNSRIARMLFAGMGKSADELRGQLNAMTSTERFDFLMGRLRAFGETGEQVSQTYTGALSNLKDAYTQIMGAAMTTATKELTKSILDLSESLMVVDSAGNKAFDPALVQSIKDTWGAVNDLYSAVNDVAGVLFGYKTEEDTLFAGLVEVIQDATHELKVFMEWYQLLGKENYQVWNPFRFITSASEAERRVAEEAALRRSGVGPFPNMGDESFIVSNPVTDPAYSFNPFQNKADDADYAKKLASMNAQLDIQVKMAEAAGIVNDLERARAQMKVDMFKADKAALEILNHISDKASDAQRAEAAKLADQTRAVGYRQAEATYARKVGEEAERQQKEQEKLRTSALKDLERMAAQHEDMLATISAETEEERKISKLMNDRDQELEKIWEARRKGTLSATEFSAALADTVTTYSLLIDDVTEDSLRKFHDGMAKESADALQEYVNGVIREANEHAEEAHERGLELLEAMRAHANAAAIGFVQTFSTELTDALADVAQTGGKNLGQIAGDTFSSLVNAGASLAMQQLMKGVVGMFGDTITETADGKYVVEGIDKPFDDFSSAVGHTKGGRALQGGVAIGGAIFNGYQQGQAGEGGRTAGAISGAAAGASVGGPYAAVFAVVGAIAGYLGAVVGEQQRQSEYKYGIPGIDEKGTAYFGYGQNMQQAEMDKARAAAQDTYDTIRNAYARVFVTLGALMPEIGKIDGKFQENPSGKYLKHLDEWLTGTLPREIASRVESALVSTLEGAGMASARVKEYMDAAKAMDPAKAATFWQTMATGIMNWRRAADAMAAVRSYMTEDPITHESSLLGGRDKFTNGRIQSGGESQFAADTRTAAEGLFQIAREMVSMTGPDRVAAFAALGAGVEDLTRSLQEFLNQVAASAKNIQQSFDDIRLNFAVDRAATPKEKADLLYSEFSSIESMLKRAVSLGLSPQDIEQLTSRGSAILQQIYRLDPTAEMAEWFNRNLDKLEDWGLTALNEVAKNAVDQVEKILETLEPFRAWFLGLPVNLQDAWDALDSSIYGAADALDALAAAIVAATPPPDDGDDENPESPGDGDGEGNGPEDGGVRDDSEQDSGGSYTTNNITVNVNGTIFGVPDLEAHVINAVQEAMRRDPDGFASTFF